MDINNISSINIVEGKNEIKPENILKSDELDELYPLFDDKDKEQKEKIIQKFASFIVQLYSNNVEYKPLLKDFLNSNNNKYYIRAIF